MAHVTFTDNKGKPRKFIVKRDNDHPDHLFFSGPPYATITPDTALALATALADVIAGERG